MLEIILSEDISLGLDSYYLSGEVTLVCFSVILCVGLDQRVSVCGILVLAGSLTSGRNQVGFFWVWFWGGISSFPYI